MFRKLFVLCIVLFCVAFQPASLWQPAWQPMASGSVVSSALFHAGLQAETSSGKAESEILIAGTSAVADSPGGQIANADKANEKPEKKEWNPPWKIHDPVFLFGILMAILGFVFWTSTYGSPWFKKLYKVVPMLLFCYFLPSLLTLGGVASEADVEALYHVSSRYLLPACLLLLTMCVDLQEIIKLGPKALIMFLTGTVGVVLGGPLAVLITLSIEPSLISTEGSEATWRGLSTIAGSWIGGGANQTAMKVLFEPADDLFSQMVAVDIIVAELWMALLLIGIGYSKEIDQMTGADTSSIENLKAKMESFSAKNARIPNSADLMAIAGIAFFVTGLCHFVGNGLAQLVKTHYPELARFSLDSGFFWLIVLVTAIGVGLSFTRVRELEGAGASKIATVFIFILVATIGLQMDLRALWENPAVFAIGGIWMAIHVVLMVVVGIAIRAPYFYLAVGSKANIGGAASAPVLAAAFHPSLAPVGVLLAVLGYVLGTFGAYLSALMMKWASGG